MVLNLCIVVALYSLAILFAESLYRYKLPPFYSRKIGHLLCGIVSAMLPILLDYKASIICCLFVASVALGTRRHKVFKSLERADETSLGTVYFPLAVLVNIILFWHINPYIISGAALVLGFADSIAAIVGKKFGKNKIYGTKTVEGTSTFILVNIIVALIVFGFSKAFKVNFINLLIIFVFSSITGVLELLSKKGIDNLLISLAAGIMFYLIL